MNMRNLSQKLSHDPPKTRLRSLKSASRRHDRRKVQARLRRAFLELARALSEIPPGVADPDLDLVGSYSLDRELSRLRNKAIACRDYLNA